MNVFDRHTPLLSVSTARNTFAKSSILNDRQPFAHELLNVLQRSESGLKKNLRP